MKERIWINRVASELVFQPFTQPRICTLSFTIEMSPWNASAWKLPVDVNVAQKLESTLQPVYVHSK